MKSPIKAITTPEELARILKEYLDAKEAVFVFFGGNKDLLKECQLKIQEHQRELAEVEKILALKIKQKNKLSLPVKKRKRK